MSKSASRHTSTSFTHLCKCTDSCTGWQDTVFESAKHLSNELGVADTAFVEALLAKVSLVHQHVSFEFDPNIDTPPGTFATIIVMLLPPDTVCLLQQVPMSSTARQ